MSTIASHQVEPIPGYVLRERLGAGGYGEVWKADAPGGLHKAVKLVYGMLDEERAANEMKALHRIRDLRHPFLLSLERIEIVDGRLIIVTELADCSLKDRFERCLAGGSVGVPRRELLQYIRDAADALDYMNEHHSLQHLDVKPENLLLVGEHVKVADFGLVKDMHQDHSMSMLAGMTPIYAATELFNGKPSRRSDQYSLAIVYQYMLTGMLPFPGRNAAQLANQHLHARPMLECLSPGDRKVIARALAKEPLQRFASCREMVEYLTDDTLRESLPAPESWFIEQVREGIPSKVATNSEYENADCTNPIHLSSEQSTGESTSERPTSSYHAPGEMAKVRGSYDMFETLDEAEHACNTAAVETIELRRDHEPEVQYIAAPELNGKFSYAPTVFVGVGRAAGIVLQQLKQRLQSSRGTSETPLAEFLLIDTDSQDIQRALRGDDGNALAPQEVIHAGLRKSQDYRSDGAALSQWLSRRWLYNIPRSQKPEGLRPLGRLAFVDHARDIHTKLKKALQRVSSPEAIEQAQTAWGHAIQSQPRVVILGAIGGGTASGMLLDLGLLARQKLSKLGFEGAEVVGVLLHYLNRTPATHELSLVNSFTLLSELAHYWHSESPFPGDLSSGLEPQAAGFSPFTSTYFLAEAGFCSEEHIAAQAQTLADYFYLNTFTPCREFFAQVQPTSAEDPSNKKLRSFGLQRIGMGASPMLPMASAALCNDLIQHWIGEANATLQSTGFESIAKAMMVERQWQLSALHARTLAEIGRLHPQVLETLLNELVPPEFNKASADLGDVNVAVNKVTQLLGICDENGVGPLDKWPKLLKELGQVLDPLADEAASCCGQLVLQTLEQAGARVASSTQFWQIINSQITTLQEEARRERTQLANICKNVEKMLGYGELLETQKKIPLRKNTREYLATFAQYIQSRRQFASYCFVEGWARRVKAQFAKIHEKVQDLRRELKHLALDLHKQLTFKLRVKESDKALGERLLATFEAERDSLLEQFDQRSHVKIFSTQGFLTTISGGGAERAQFIAKLVQLADELLNAALQKTNLPEYLLGTDPETNQPRVQALMQAAKPRLLDDARVQTLIALNETTLELAETPALLHSVAAVTHTTPSVVCGHDAEISMLMEASEQSLRAVALRLIDYRPDLIECAARIFSRNDIPFQAISTKHTS